ncbi:MAG: GNAT family N-acetyltransferase [Bacilli bacterium]|nr:GNAT family N-acetyltransferase [Bacilli bacterium]
MTDFRLANKNDASVYAHLINQSWKDTYGEYISIEHIDNEFNIEKIVNTFEKHINDTTFETYMIQYNGQIVGLVEFGSPDVEDVYKEDLESFGQLRRLYINKSYQDLGIGKETERFVSRSLIKKGYKYSFLWVKKQNNKAIHFYEKCGYVKSEYTCENPSDGAPSFVMEKVLEEE